jgi:hypothetical protein
MNCSTFFCLVALAWVGFQAAVFVGALADGASEAPPMKLPPFDGESLPLNNAGQPYISQYQPSGQATVTLDRTGGVTGGCVKFELTEGCFYPQINAHNADGTHSRDIKGQELKLALPDSDSGVFLRGNGKNQVNIWCWPIGSGEFYGYRMDNTMPPEVRAGVTPPHQADKPVGQWSRFEITARGDQVTVVPNGIKVIDKTQIPGIAESGPITLQHHGGKRNGQWDSPPSLLQFKNIFIKELK